MAAKIPNAAAVEAEDSQERPDKAGQHDGGPGRVSPADRALALSSKPSVKIVEPCASCGVKCCNRFAVPLTGFDVVRILDKLGGEPTEFAQLADARSIEGSPHSTVFIFEHGKLSERLLVLKRHQKTNWCVFSRHSAGCAIWGFHPMVCRAYPFILKPEGGLGYTKNYACPRSWEKGEYAEAGVRQVVEQQNEELAQYNKLVRAWNAEKAKKGDEKGFWKYILQKSRQAYP
ncbi:MAG: YkgJ family cysteine cluster protein [Candidatus Marsarchaeota archaeon]|nr:YkgJ family cysteine cluster protein [Candidatus Marsarchaeota archaeon]